MFDPFDLPFFRPADPLRCCSFARCFFCFEQSLTVALSSSSSGSNLRPVAGQLNLLLKRGAVCLSPRSLARHGVPTQPPQTGRRLPSPPVFPLFHTRQHRHAAASKPHASRIPSTNHPLRPHPTWALCETLASLSWLIHGLVTPPPQRSRSALRPPPAPRASAAALCARPSRSRGGGGRAGRFVPRAGACPQVVAAEPSRSPT